MTDINVKRLITTITGVKNLRTFVLFIVRFNKDKECSHGHFIRKMAPLHYLK